jgi:hypothetical protein
VVVTPGRLTHEDHARAAALAAAALPAGERAPAAGGATADALDALLATLPAPLRATYLGLLRALDGHALVRRGRPLARLAHADVLEHLQIWRGASYPRRLALRALLHPLKALHCDSPPVRAALGDALEPPIARAPRPHPRHQRAATLGPEPIECDVAVIGTGAGGAVAAHALARRGLAVAMLEEGALVTRERFTGRGLDMQRLLWRDGGLTASVGNVVIPIPVGRAVGGTTLINSGTCLRPPARVFERFRREHGLAELDAAELDPRFDALEAILGVTAPEPRALGAIPRLIARGCDALGWRGHRPLPRGAPGCEGRGVCALGCPTDAKRSANVSFVPMALAEGAALFTELYAERVESRGGRVTGVSARDPSGRSSTPSESRHAAGA